MLGEAVFDRADLPPVAAFSRAELTTLRSMLVRGLNSPWTSSAGRLFDAVASLAGLRQQIRFEGQAAMELEFALEGVETDETYPFAIADCRLPIEKPAVAANKSALRTPHSAFVLDWSPMVQEILADAQRGVPVGAISAKFHNALAEGIVAVARRAGIARVVLTGGCFQNRYLTERAVQRLRAEGFQPCWHQRVPPNDGGIALGQIVAAMRKTESNRVSALKMT